MNIDELYKKYQESGKVFIDSRKASEGGIFFGIKGENFDGNDFAEKAFEMGADCVVTNKKELCENKNFLFAEKPLETLQELGKKHRRNISIPLIGITGTNGKTTTKELILSVLSQKLNVYATSGNFNNHIGVPLSILEINKKHEIAIIEMGANHPGEIGFLCNISQPTYGLITNVGMAHLEGFGSFKGVKQTKKELYDYLKTNNGKVFINTSNIHLQEMLGSYSNRIEYGYLKSAMVHGSIADGEGHVNGSININKQDLAFTSQLTGSYNFENILAAATIGFHFNLSNEQILNGIQSYTPSNKRSEIKKTEKNTLYIDCYNANPSSMSASIKHFLSIKDKRKVVILGDMLELGSYSKNEHQKISDIISNQPIDQVVLIGSEFLKVDSPEQFIKYESTESFLNSDDFKKIPHHSTILLKGSRGIALEKLIDHL